MSSLIGQMGGSARFRAVAQTIVGALCRVPARPGKTYAKGTGDERYESVAKQVKQLDRVIIRFAGDSGDGMQLTGDRFTQETASFGNDLVDAAQLPGRDPGPPGHAARGVVVPGALRRPRHPHRGRRARRAGGDEPRRAAGQPRRPPQGRDDHRRHPRLHRPQPDQGRLRRQPARGRRLRRVRAARRRPDRHDRRGRQGVRPLPQGRLARQEHVRPRPAVLDVRPPDRVDRRFLEKRFAKVPDIRDANITAFKAGWNFGETTETFVVRYEIKPRRCRRAPTATSPATSPSPTA